MPTGLICTSSLVINLCMHVCAYGEEGTEKLKAGWLSGVSEVRGLGPRRGHVVEVLQEEASSTNLAHSRSGTSGEAPLPRASLSPPNQLGECGASSWLTSLG